MNAGRTSLVLESTCSVVAEAEGVQEGGRSDSGNEGEVSAQNITSE